LIAVIVLVTSSSILFRFSFNYSS